MTSRRFLAFVLCFLAACHCPPTWQLRADETSDLAFFEAKIRPVLIKHCYECHAVDSQEIGGSLTLDSAAGLLRGGDSGPAIVPGQPDKSLLIEAVRYEDVQMPPAGRLPEDVVRDLQRWVKMGAPDPRAEIDAARANKNRVIDIEQGKKFWAFQPIQSYPQPEVKNHDWPKSSIDTFVLAKLEQSDLQPAPDAQRITLIRRIYFDLIGLPPSPQEVQQVLVDESENALADLVDRLLASPQFGVHWGRHWLDVSRYADSNGGDFNATFHNAWKYRDYVFSAYNNDKPFDQFVREQIAGDLLDADNDAQRTEQIVATGFLMIGAKMLSERDKTKLTMDVVDEQLNTVGQAFMGMTIGCARCHDHKFDPIPTSDYYALAGIFRSTRTLEGESQEYVSTWPRRLLPAAQAQVDAVAAYEKSLAELEKQKKAKQKQRGELTKKIDQLKQNSNLLVFDDADAKLTGIWKQSTSVSPFVGAGYIHDDRSEKGEKYAEFTLNIPAAALYDVQIAYTTGDNRAKNVPVSIRHAEGEVVVKLDESKKPPIDGSYASVGNFRFNPQSPSVVTISNVGTEEYVIVDAVRLVEIDKDGKVVKPESDAESQELEVARAELTKLDDELKQFDQQLKELQSSAPAALPRAIAVDEAKVIGDCQICIRGEHDNLGEAVPRGFLQVATSADTKPVIITNESGRRQLAQWLSSADHPLTARVYVNRVWNYLLGRGIVASVDNFGELGNRPTHPELLDNLASEFIRDGWSTKSLIRRIVLSRTYQMSSRHDERSWNIDPENNLLWRAHRKRVVAESIRDSMLAISGRLDLAPAGSPVEGLGTLVTQNTAEQSKFDRGESFARSAYLPLIRAELPPILVAFDFADPDLVMGQRSETNVPGQALLLLNSPFVMQQAVSTAARVRESVGVEDEASPAVLQQAYQFVLSRQATDAELQRARSFIEQTSVQRATTAGKKSTVDPLAQFIHTLFACTEFRMLD